MQYFHNAWAGLKVAFPIAVIEPTGPGGRVGFQIQASIAIGGGSD